MSIAQLIKTAASQGIFLYQKDGQLGFRLSVEQFPAQLKSEIVANKAQIIAYLTKADEQPSLPTRPTIEPRAEQTGPVVTSYGQQRLWFIDRLDEGSSQYNAAMALEVNGEFDVAVAEQAIALIVEQHQVLRTVFVDQQGQPMQQVLDDVEFTLQHHPLYEMSRAQQQQTVMAMIKQDAAKVFDISKDLMLRASYLSLASGKGVLLFNIHHIASDGWSNGILIQSFLNNYQALLADKNYRPQPLAIQYADYACWQRDWLSGEVLDQQLQYWQQQLHDVPDVHSVPLDFTRPEEEGYHGARVYGHVDKALSDALHAMARQHQMTLFMLLHGALSLLLAKLGNHCDVIVGTPIANRLQNELKPLIGFFTNTLALRVNTEQSDLSTYLAHVRQVNLDAQSHQDVPFEFLLDHCDISRNLAHSPLFQIMFNMDTNESSAMHLPGVDFSPLEGAEVQAMFDLDVNAQLSPHGIELLWVYDTGLFAEHSVERFNRCFEQLLSSMAAAHASGEQALAKLRLLNQDDAHQALTLANQAPLPYDRDTLSYQRFTQIARQNADATAVIAPNGQLSYAQLALRAQKLVTLLYSAKPQLVAVMLSKSIEAPLAFMALLGSGCCYVPVNPELPLERIQSIIEQGKITTLLTEIQFTDLAKPLQDSHAVQCHYLDRFDWDQMPSGETLVDIKPDSLAYCIFTSGTTGQPKGVLIEQQSILAQYYSWAQIYQLETTTKVHLQLAGLAFDVSIGDFVRALLSGGTLLLCDKETMLTPAKMLADIGLHQVNFVEFVPAVLEVFLAHLRQLLEADDIATLAKVASVDTVVVGSDAWTVNQHNEAQQLLNDVGKKVGKSCALINSYGLTECSVDSSYYLSDWYQEGKASASNIGRAIPNVQFFVLDRQQQLLPVGALGELYVGGLSVGRGYLAQPKLTDERFISDSAFAERLYKSGDLVRLLPNGTLDFYGRVDEQVKIRGYRIELGDIQAQILTHQWVKSSLIKVAKQASGQKQLVAYLLAEGDIDASHNSIIEAVRSQLNSALPDYMVPYAFVVVDAWPLSANGKIDKKALPVPDLNPTGADITPPNGEHEHILHQVWAGLLKIDPAQLSVQANFFALGGDSILSIQVVSRSAQQGLYFSVKDLFSAQSIRQLALLATTDADSQQRFVSPQQAQQGSMALLPIQQQLFEDLTDWHWDNQSMLLVPPAGFDVALLNEFVTALYWRHDVLRLAFESDKNGQWQGRYIEHSAQMQQACVSRQSLVWTDEAAFTEASNRVQASLQPQRGQVFKAVLFDIDGAPTESNQRLLLVLHHLVVDGVSWRVLLTDLQQLFDQHLAGQPLQLAAKTGAYAQWSEFLHHYGDSDLIAEQRDYWLAAAAAPIPELPLVKSGNERAYCRIQLSQTTTADLLAKSHQAYGTQINELLLAGVLLAFHREAQIDGIRIDLEGHGREPISDSIDLSETLGWFTTVFPLTLQYDPQSDLNNGDKLAQLICQVKEQYRQLPANGIGFGVLKYLTKLPELIEMPAPAIVFNYLGQFDQVTESDSHFLVAGESAGFNVSPNRPDPHALMLDGMVTGGQLGLQLGFLGDNFAQMEGLLAAIGLALEDIVAHCVDAKPYVTPADFPLAEVSMAQLDVWQQQLDLVNLYPATGMQQGMLFHSLLGQGNYVGQTSLTFGELNLVLFKQAWQQVIDRHDIFRTTFVGLDSGNPLQLVQKQAQMQWSETDIRHLSFDEQNQFVSDFAANDKANGCDISQAPLMHMSVIKRHSDEACETPQLHVIWTVHHALLDGWCTPIVFAEVTACYGALLNGGVAELAPVPPFYQYAQWLAEQDKNAADEFWAQQLSGLSAPTPLPLHRQSAQNSHSAEVISAFVELDNEQSAALQQLAKQAQTTVNVLLQGAWALLLGRYAQQSTVAFGATTSGRPPELADAERMVGLFINTLPIVVDLDDNSHLAQWFGTLHQQLVARETYSYTPLQDIQRQASFNGNLFDSLLIFENFPVDESIGEKVVDAELQLQSIRTVEETNYDITLLASLSARLSVQVDFQKQRYHPVQAEQIAGHLRQILLGLITQPAEQTLQLVLADVELMAQAEKAQILSHSVTEMPQQLPQKKPATSIYALFEANCQQRPDAVAVSFEQQDTTYAQLEHKVQWLALKLSRQNAGPLIGVCLPRGVDLLASMLAVLRVGAAYVPLDPNYPEHRIEQILAATGLRHVCDSSDFDGYDAQAELPQHQRQVGDIAYVIYTSGSTGTPKGVVISQQAFVHFTQAINQQTEGVLSHQARVLALTTVSFDIAGLELLAPLCFGARVVLASQTQVADPQQISQLLEQYDVTLMQATPGHWQQLVDSNWRGKENLVGLCGGEAVSASLAMALAYRCLRAYNCYGPTEATIWSAVQRFDANASADEICNIGAALPGYQHLVLDETGRLVPVGCVGQLYIGGAALAEGYFKRDDLTAASFIDHPLADRLYRSGDLVRLNADGSTGFVGRVDSQVKIRGYRIELSEIEYQLHRHALLVDGIVRDAIVTVDAHNTHNRLVAHVLVDETDETELFATLTAHLSATLPDYMVPTLFVAHREFAQTNNGKVDRRAVAQAAKGIAAQDIIAPANALEQQLQQVWAKVLDVETGQVCVQSNFFSLGGDSLLILPLVKQVNAALNTAISLKDVYEQRSIRALATLITQSSAVKEIAAQSLVKLNTNESGQHLFVLHPIIGFVNCYMDFARQLEGDIGVYGVQAPYCFGHELRFNSMTELAQFYAQGIVSVQASGPYRLAGWSAGGSIAFYVADVLQQWGHEVDYVALIEPSPLDKFSRYNRHQALDIFLATILSDDIHSDASRRESLLQLVLDQADEAQGLQLLAEAISEMGSERLSDAATNLIYIKAGMDYFLAQRQGRKLQNVKLNRLFTTQAPEQEAQQYQLDWRGYLNGTINHLCVSGDHGEMMEGAALQQISAAVAEDLAVLNRQSNNQSNFTEGETDVV